jgi:hypothetical protein
LSQGGGPYITEREYPLMSAEDPNYDTLEAEMIDG